MLFSGTQNPFALPEDDEEIFLLKEREKRRRLEERKRMLSLPIAEKVPSTSTNPRVKIRNRPYTPTVEEQEQIGEMTESINSLLTLNRNGGANPLPLLFFWVMIMTLEEHAKQVKGTDLFACFCGNLSIVNSPQRGNVTSRTCQRTLQRSAKCSWCSTP